MHTVTDVDVDVDVAVVVVVEVVFVQRAHVVVAMNNGWLIGGGRRHGGVDKMMIGLTMKSMFRSL